MSTLVTVTDTNFDDEVAQSSVPVLVDFWAIWCGPCRVVAPVVEEIANEQSGKLKVAKVDVDANPITAQQYGIMSIPTLMVFKNGQPVERIIGFMPKQQLMRRIEPHLS